MTYVQRSVPDNAAVPKWYRSTYWQWIGDEFGRVAQAIPRRWIDPIGDFGIADGKSDNDMTSNWQRLFDQMTQDVGCLFPTTMRTVITAPIRIWGKQRLSVECFARRSFFADLAYGFDYRGPEGTAAFQIFNTFGVTWKGVGVLINADGKRGQGGFDVDQFPHGTVVAGGTVPDGTTSDNEFEGLCIRSEGSSAAAYGIRWSYTSWQNVENQTARRVAVVFNQSLWDCANLDRGRAFKIGGGAEDAGANTKNLTLELCGSVGAAHFLEAAGGSSIEIAGGETNASTIDVKLESSVVHVRRLRSESGRQFLVGGGTLTVHSNELGSSKWDPAYPVVELSGRTSIDWRGNSVDRQKGIRTIAVTDPQKDQVSFSGDGGSGAWADQPPDWSQFVQGAVCTNPQDGLALVVGGGAADFGMAVKLSSAIIASLWNRDFGDGTLLYVRDARPGCADLLHDPTPHGAGALAMKLGGVWRTFA